MTAHDEDLEEIVGNEHWDEDDIDLTESNDDSDDLIVLPNTVGLPSKRFHGKLIAESTTDTGSSEQQRWTELRLYWFTDGTGRYMAVSIGRSVVYHDVDGCPKGVLVDVTKLSKVSSLDIDELQPCRHCHPPDVDELAGITHVKLEKDRPTLHECRDAYEVVQKMRDPKNGGRISGPAIQLLEEAASVDENIRRVLGVVEDV